MTTYLMIGAGKLAQHLQYYLSALGHTSLLWDRAQDPHLLNAKLEKSTHVLLAISDSALENFYRSRLAGFDKTVVHFSGAVYFEGAVAAHPLMTFGPELYTLETYKKIHFVLSGSDRIGEVLPGLPNSFSVLSAGAKPFYHALCVMGGNFPTILWQKMFADFAALGIPEHAAHLYLQTILQNTLQNPRTALTGPLARMDIGTIEKNLRALEGDPFHAVYEAFVQAVAPEIMKERLR